MNERNDITGMLDLLTLPGFCVQNNIITALNSAVRRDSASGDGMLVAYIDAEGYHDVPNEEIRTRMASQGYKYPN